MIDLFMVGKVKRHTKERHTHTRRTKHHHPLNGLVLDQDKVGLVIMGQKVSGDLSLVRVLRSSGKGFDILCNTKLVGHTLDLEDAFHRKDPTDRKW